MALDEYGQPDSPTDISVTSDYYATPDYHLRALVALSDRFDNGFAVTLVVAGGIISGVLTTHRKFLRDSAEVIRSLGEESGEEKIAKFANETAKDSFDDVAQRIDDEIRADFESLKNGGDSEEVAPIPRAILTRYACLDNALYHQAGSTPIELGCTRVMLSQVSAWSVGRPS